MIRIYRPESDNRSRRRWEFQIVNGVKQTDLVLKSYGVERREFARGRFRQPVRADIWQSADERHYASGLSRPTIIPDDVIQEALAHVRINICIGWANTSSQIMTVNGRNI